jgi:dienelactone hydrolase
MAELHTGRHDVDVEHVTLKGGDGAPVDAVHARPDGMPVGGLVLHPDIMGVRPLFEDLCRRLATHGFAVLAPEPFARAPVEISGGEDVAARMAHLRELDDDVQIGDLEAAADYLVVNDDVREVGVLGFCMGGMQALKAAATGRFDRAVVLYAGGRHRGAACRVGEPAGLRDRRVPRGRPRVRACARAPGAPGRRRGGRLAARPRLPVARLTLLDGSLTASRDTRLAAVRSRLAQRVARSCSAWRSMIL